ncbi:MAG: insulinase family protein, partial [Bacteroidetes bacterium]|nr:insulinase family protein [Bacteroidota bacterium]
MSSKLVSTILLASCLLGTAGRAQKQSPPEGGQPKDFVLPQKSVMSFDNGLQVTLVQYGLVPKVTVQAVLRTGNIDEAENEVWLADMTGDLMKEGT